MPAPMQQAATPSSARVLPPVVVEAVVEVVALGVVSNVIGCSCGSNRGGSGIGVPAAETFRLPNLPRLTPSGGSAPVAGAPAPSLE